MLHNKLCPKWLEIFVNVDTVFKLSTIRTSQLQEMFVYLDTVLQFSTIKKNPNNKKY